MAVTQFSFDIVSRVDMMEVKNAIDQAQRELENRYDFKGTKAEIQFEKEQIRLIADDEFRMKQLKDIVESKLIKRGIDIRQIDYGKAEPATGMTIRQDVQFKVGIPQDKAKALTKALRDSGVKVQAQIQGDEVRVSGKSKDDLQKAIAFVKAQDLDYPVAFVNYR